VGYVFKDTALKALDLKALFPKDHFYLTYAVLRVHLRMKNQSCLSLGQSVDNSMF
jgi:hypothetical protein